MGGCRHSVGAFRTGRKLSLCTQITQNISHEPSWEASGMSSLERSTFPIFQLSFQKPHGYVRKNRAWIPPRECQQHPAVPPGPQGSGAGFQDGLGCCTQRCQHRSGLGSLRGSGTSTQHCTRTRAQRLLLPPPCPSVGLTLHPRRNPNRFLSKSNSLEHGEPAAPLLGVQLCKGVTDRGET